MKTLNPIQRHAATGSVVRWGIAALFLVWGTSAYAVITGSAHDFQSATWNSTGEICVVCHAPHNAINPSAGPLWNRTLTSATYTLYNSVTPPGSDLEATTISSLAQPSGVSKLCLSCHDGSIALDSFGGATGSTLIGSTWNIGETTGGTGDLSNDHPVSFTYPATDAEIRAKSGTSPNFVVTHTTGTVPLFGTNGTVECATCHDVHNTNTVGKLLRVAQNTTDGGVASGLCLTCHDK